MDSKATKYIERRSNGIVLRVRKESDMVLWHNSIAYHELIAYINRTSTMIQGIQQLDPVGYPVSATMLNLCGIFDQLAQRLTHLKSNSSDSYHIWSRHMLRNIFNMLEQALPSNKCEHIGELGQYLASSFGNNIRIDYGTGHELSFVFFLCGLFQAQILQPEDEIAAALMLFVRYLRFVRRLQTQFGLKPAGNQCAYSLDNYQFVAYLWGAAQLCYEPPFSPKQMLDPDTFAQWRHQYLIAACVSFVAQTKPGNFAMHSSQLWSISALSSWRCVYHGFHSMYLKEVICQFHLMRHICFGQLLPFEPAPPGSQLIRAQLGYLSHDRLQYLMDSERSTHQQQQQQQQHKEGELEKERNLQLTKIETQHSGLSALSAGRSITSWSGVSTRLTSLTKRLNRQHEERVQHMTLKR